MCVISILIFFFYPFNEQLPSIYLRSLPSDPQGSQTLIGNGDAELLHSEEAAQEGINYTCQEFLRDKLNPSLIHKQVPQ